MIEDFLRNTHAATHNQYKMELTDVYEVTKDGEENRFVDCGNRSGLLNGTLWG